MTNPFQFPPTCFSDHGQEFCDIISCLSKCYIMYVKNFDVEKYGVGGLFQGFFA